MVEETGRDREAVIPILQRLQEHYRYLPEAALERVCELTEITAAQIEGDDDGADLKDWGH